MPRPRDIWIWVGDERPVARRRYVSRRDGVGARIEQARALFRRWLLARLAPVPERWN